MQEDNEVLALCEELGLNQSRLADLLGASVATVIMWRKRNSIPPLGKKAINFYKENIELKKELENLKSALLTFSNVISK